MLGYDTSYVVWRDVERFPIYPLPIKPAMTDFLLEPIDLSDYTVVDLATIDLTPSQVAAALNQAASSSHPGPTDPWQSYLNALADLGLAQWLSDRAPTLPIQQISTGLWQVNGFRIATVAITDAEVLIATARLSPTTAAHLYVAVTVQEEQAQVSIAGSIRVDQLTRQPTPIGDDTYCLTIADLDQGSNQLLLTLRCADPATIPLPIAQPTATQPTAAQPVGQASTPTSTPASTPTSTPGRINVGQWLNRQLDQVATDLAWILMPPLALPTAMRSASPHPASSPASSPEATLSHIHQTLTRQGLIISPTAQSAYQDLNITEPELRVYATIAALAAGEWSLLLIVGTQSGEALPANFQLSLSDGTQVLFEQMVEVARSQSYLYAQVIGAIDETFQVTITLPNGISHTLPEFGFAV
jgi:Protein of unknown function (DUF1822)